MTCTQTSLTNLTRRLVDRGGSRRSLLRWAAVLALPELHALGSLPARAAEVPDAQGPAPGSISGYGRNRLAQTCKAQHTGRLTRAKVWAHSLSSTNTDDYLFEIRTTMSNGKPSKAVLASTQVNDIVWTTFPQMTEVTIQFTPGARVKKGERYALVVTGLSGALTVLQSNESPGCAGTRFEGDLNNKFGKDTNADIVFATFVTRA